MNRAAVSGGIFAGQGGAHNRFDAQFFRQLQIHGAVGRRQLHDEGIGPDGFQLRLPQNGGGDGVENQVLPAYNLRQAGDFRRLIAAGLAIGQILRFAGGQGHFGAQALQQAGQISPHMAPVPPWEWR